MKTNKFTLMLLATVIILSACGGGGGGGASDSGSATASSNKTFPVNLAIANVVTSGFDAPFVISGTANSSANVSASVTGQGTNSMVPAVTATFDSHSALDAANVVSGSMTVNGTTLPTVSTTHQYFSIGNFYPLGQIDVEDGTHYLVTSFSGWPVAAKVGDSGTLGTVTIYTNYTRETISGYQRWSYTIEPDAADTAIFAWTIVETDANQANSVTQTDRYRVTSAGGITFVSSHGVASDSTVGFDLTITATSVRTPGITPAPAPWTNPTAPLVKGSLGGSISGLTADGLVLMNGAEAVRPSANATSFAFPSLLADGTTYNVTVQTQPSGLLCSVANQSGTIGAGTSPTVSCDPLIAHCPAGSNVLFFNGDSNDYIHPGRETLTNNIWSGLSSTPQDIVIRFSSVSIGSTWWDLYFSSRSLGQPIQVGTYDQAERAAFASLGHPGMDIGGSGRGCNSIAGKFQVEEITWSGSTLKSFTASFEQHCEASPSALRGCVHFEQ